MKFKVGDRVKAVGIIDGKHINGYYGTVRIASGDPILIEFDDYMGGHTGSGRCEDGHGWWCLINELEPIKPESIVIYQKNETVVAKNTATGEKAVAKCHPDDEFDFKVGAGVAFDRLMGREVEKPKFIDSFEEGKTYKFDKETYMKFNNFESLYPLHWAYIINGKVVTVESESHGIIPDGTSMPWAISPNWCVEVTEEPKKEEYYNGKVVCIDPGMIGVDLTKGKIYEVVDGYLIDDVGDKRPTCTKPSKSLDELVKHLTWKLIEVVE